MQEIDLSHIGKPNRIISPVQYHGGKGRIVKRILPHIPIDDVYCEPFCGGASVFWHINGFKKYILNDIDSDVINIYKIIQKDYKLLQHYVIWTPYARSELERAIDCSFDDNVLRAWQTMVKSNFSIGGKKNPTLGCWSRQMSRNVRGVAGNCNRWRKRMNNFDFWHNKLKDVILENRDAIDVIKEYDNENVVFYLDPPYIKETRKSKNEYEYELDIKYHKKLIEVLLEIKGSFVLFGYEHDIYKPLNKFRKVVIKTSAQCAVRTRNSKLRGLGSATKYASRSEILWIKDNKKSIFEQ